MRRPLLWLPGTGARRLARLPRSVAVGPMPYPLLCPVNCRRASAPTNWAVGKVICCHRVAIRAIRWRAASLVPPIQTRGGRDGFGPTCMTEKTHAHGANRTVVRNQVHASSDWRPELPNQSTGPNVKMAQADPNGATAAPHPEEMKGTVTFKVGSMASVTATGRTTPAGLISAALLACAILVPLCLARRRGR